MVNPGYLFLRVRSKSSCFTPYVCFPFRTGQQPVLPGGWWIGILTSPLFLESLSSYHFTLNMDGKGSPNLTFCVYAALKCKCSFLMEDWMEQYLIEPYGVETCCWVFSMSLACPLYCYIKARFSVNLVPQIVFSHFVDTSSLNRSFMFIRNYVYFFVFYSFFFLISGI